LDEPATVRVSATGRTVVTRELYVARIPSVAGPKRRVAAVAVANREQAEGFTFRYVMPFTLEERVPITLTYGTATARRRADVPVSFEAIDRRSEER
jgi:hypothetical protein